MIYNPATIAFGDHAEMTKAIEMLNEVKESIINAYVIKTGQSRAKLSHLMDAETWMDANKAVELGFADGIFGRATETEDQEEKPQDNVSAVLFSSKAVNNALVNKLTAKYGEVKKTSSAQSKIEAPKEEMCSAEKLRERLELIEKYI